MMPAEQASLKRPAMADLLFGLFLVCLAIGVFWATRKLSVGSAAAMGPGYFPLAIAWGALGFGVLGFRIIGWTETNLRLELA